MSKLELFSTNGCAGCKAIAQHLTRQGVAFNLLKVDENKEAYTAFKAAGYKTVPQLCLPDGTLLAASLMELVKIRPDVLAPFKSA